MPSYETGSKWKTSVMNQLPWQPVWTKFHQGFIYHGLSFKWKYLFAFPLNHTVQFLSYLGGFIWSTWSSFRATAIYFWIVKMREPLESPMIICIKRIFFPEHSIFVIAKILLRSETIQALASGSETIRGFDHSEDDSGKRIGFGGSNSRELHRSHTGELLPGAGREGKPFQHTEGEFRKLLRVE